MGPTCNNLLWLVPIYTTIWKTNQPPTEYCISQFYIIFLLLMIVCSYEWRGWVSEKKMKQNTDVNLYSTIKTNWN